MRMCDVHECGMYVWLHTVLGGLGWSELAHVVM
jgi:hypothetical protein